MNQQWKIRTILVSCLLFLVSALWSQSNITTVGIQIKPIISGQLFNTGPQTIESGEVDFTIDPSNGYAFGMVIRKGLNDQFSIETGINYSKRNYDLTISIDSNNFEGNSDFSYVIYELPVLALIYVRLGERSYLNNAFGINLNFLPSDWQSFDTYFEHYSSRSYWVVPALQANVGFEYRTYESGFLYLGFSLHRPFSKITTAGVLYKEDNLQKETVYFDILGNYLTVDLRYFFHEDPERKRKRR